MNELSSILVTYDNSKNDISTIICGRYMDDGEVKICAGYTGESADELYKMVSEPGYLYEHDKKLVEKERRRIYEEYMRAAKADSEASIHGDIFPKYEGRFWQEMRGKYENR